LYQKCRNEIVRRSLQLPFLRNASRCFVIVRLVPSGFARARESLDVIAIFLKFVIFEAAIGGWLCVA
jgi:hypothetical protein